MRKRSHAPLAPDTGPANAQAPRATDRDRDDTPGAARDKPSKTRLKREMHERQTVGKSLVALDDHQLAGLPIDERLADAVRAARTTRTHEGLRRQLQYIGRLMREVDFDALRRALSEIRR